MVQLVHDIMIMRTRWPTQGSMCQLLLPTGQEELKLLKRNNDKKEGRLKRAREKDFTKKIQSVQVLLS